MIIEMQWQHWGPNVWAVWNRRDLFFRLFDDDDDDERLDQSLYIRMKQ